VRAFLILLVLAAAAPCSAQAMDLPARAAAVLEHGHPYVEVRPDPNGAGGVVRGVIDIAAPVDVVWKVMTDCELAPKMVANLRSCRVLERDPAGRWDVREFVSRPTVVLPPVRNIFRSDYQPDEKITFHRTGGDLQVFEGEWRVEPHDGQVRVSYEARIGAPFSVPGWLARIALRSDVHAALLAFQREAVARAP
jgi:polyketide cyclase/dehydrase/lipid transport protein